jgi:hypothetical protein
MATPIDAPMTDTALNRLLRAALTAVNQQSVHLLALRHWGGGELEARIRDVDRSDFPATLAIIEHMVVEGVPFRIASEGFVPGAGERDILLAEQRAERVLEEAIAPLRGLGGAPGRIAAMVAGPRDDYARWIAARLPLAPDHPGQAVPLVGELAELFGALTVLGEQALVHAFLHWHRGAVVDADAAWGMSGSAMIRAGDVIRLLADEGAVPVPGQMPAIDIRATAADAVEADRNLAARCREAARAAAVNSASVPAREVAGRIAAFAEVWVGHRAGEPLAPEAGATRTFASFERTRRKLLPGAS